MNELELKIFDLICQANDKSSEGKHFTVYGVIAVNVIISQILSIYNFLIQEV